MFKIDTSSHKPNTEWERLVKFTIPLSDDQCNKKGEHMSKLTGGSHAQAFENLGKLYAPQGWEGVGYVREVAASNTQASSILIQ